MSERLNSVDIEDVLSSIRRLVSDDKRPAAQAAKPVAPAVPVADPQADKLILTPALRIAPEAEARPEAGSDAQPDTQPEPAADDPAADDPSMVAAQAAESGLSPSWVEPSEAPMAFHSIRADRAAARIDAVMGEVARGLESGSGDWETPAEAPRSFASDWSEAGMPEAPFAGMTGPSGAEPIDALSMTEGEAPRLPDPLGDVSDIPSAWATETEILQPGEDDLVASAESADVFAASDAPAEILTDRLPDDWPSVDWASAGEDLAESPDLQDAWSPATSAETDAPPVALAEEPAMTDKDDAPDLPETQQPETDLPDWARMEDETLLSEPEPVAASLDPRWADAAEAEIRRELEEEVSASAFARFADDDLDDRPFDEEMLRDLVRDIIREELQGALGERITRNVRKLVRAEIARALAVRDFE